MKTRILWFIWFIVGLFSLGAASAALIRFSADSKQWDVKNNIPSSSIESSKAMGVFIAEYNLNESRVNLGSASYRVSAVWVEYKATTERSHWWSVQLVKQPAKTLCIFIEPTAIGYSSSQNELGVLVGNERKEIASGIKRAICFDLHTEAPSEIVIYNPRATHERAVLALSQK